MRTRGAGGWAGVCAICSSIGCSKTPSAPATSGPPAASDPSLARMTLAPLPLTAPPCGVDGPALSARHVGWGGGKTPYEHAHFELVVKNPLSRPLWLFAGEEPEYVPLITGISLGKLAGGRGHLWAFLPDLFDAIRIAPGASVTWHDRVLTAPQGRRTTFLFTTATEVWVAETPSATWFGDEGLTTTGEIGPRDGPVTVRDRQAPAGLPLRIEVLCTTEVHVAPPKIDSTP